MADDTLSNVGLSVVGAAGAIGAGALAFDAAAESAGQPAAPGALWFAPLALKFDAAAFAAFAAANGDDAADAADREEGWAAHAPASAPEKVGADPETGEGTPGRVALEAATISNEAFEFGAKLSMGGPIGIVQQSTSKTKVPGLENGPPSSAIQLGINGFDWQRNVAPLRRPRQSTRHPLRAANSAAPSGNDSPAAQSESGWEDFAPR